jgi:hypothetical protein
MAMDRMGVSPAQSIFIDDNRTTCPVPRPWVSRPFTTRDGTAFGRIWPGCAPRPWRTTDARRVFPLRPGPGRPAHHRRAGPGGLVAALLRWPYASVFFLCARRFACSSSATRSGWFRTVRARVRRRRSGGPAGPGSGPAYRRDEGVVCIFMNVFNVHVEPGARGRDLERIEYFPGSS